ncbi:MAG: P-II family nitrogen regulator [Rhodospirillaceae bacterium]|nr:P-II family nitrogen regulator [Rhodospirillaceae bacterium]
MKLIVAVIRPAKLDGTRDALSGLGSQGLTVTEVRGFGRQRGHTEFYRGAEYTVNFLPKIKVEVAVGDDLEGRVVECIQQIAHTGQIGDGKVFGYDPGSVVPIRTGETGEQEL